MRVLKLSHMSNGAVHGAAPLLNRTTGYVSG
jgi:hypothetical protein